MLSKIEDPSLDHVHSSVDRGARDPNHAHLNAMAESKEEILWKHPTFMTLMKTPVVSSRPQPKDSRIANTKIVKTKTKGKGGKTITPTLKPSC